MLNNFSHLSLIILIPFLGMLFTLAAKDSDEIKTNNAFNVAIFTVISNIIMLMRMFALIKVDTAGLQLTEKYAWMKNPDINIMLGVDILSLMMLLAIHIAYIIGYVGIRNNNKKQKSLLVLSLLFLSMVNGFFISGDIFSFYMFFEAMLIPLFLLLGMFGDIKRKEYINRFFVYNMVGAILFFAAVVLLFNYQKGVLGLQQLSLMDLSNRLEYFIWGAIFLSLLSRIPVWPFHYWISSVDSNLRNPMVFIISIIIPLTGLYGFIRFLPQTLPQVLDIVILILQIISVITMLFIALIGFTNKDRQYKIFSYVTVYYIMYLLGIITGKEVILLNIVYSLFSYLLIVASLEIFSYYLYKEQSQYSILDDGMLCAYPRLSLLYSFMSLAAVGLPISSLFLSNFLILSNLLASNIQMGIIMLLAIIIVSCALLNEFFRLRDFEKWSLNIIEVKDISPKFFSLMIFVCFCLLMSFIKPLWFLFIL